MSQRHLQAARGVEVLGSKAHPLDNVISTTAAKRTVSATGSIISA